MADPDQAELDRMLAVAAVLRTVLGGTPVVVGGVAEMYWTRLPYHPTDLDVCAPVHADDVRRLQRAGFVREGRHWWHEEHGVAVEFPEAVADADPARLHEDRGAVIIGVSDLYVDSLRQSTANDNVNPVEHQSLLAVASSCMEIIDWPYVRRRIAAEPDHLRTLMHRNDRRARRIARSALG